MVWLNENIIGMPVIKIYSFSKFLIYLMQFQVKLEPKYIVNLKSESKLRQFWVTRLMSEAVHFLILKWSIKVQWRRENNEKTPLGKK